jgi:eukaryotic-like serine/threonine-protein kinase
MATPSKTIKIGKYDVIDLIGRGGMGVVYKAKDPVLDRLVAIKMMNVDVHENTDFLERFYREAKSTASLRHPNIVTVYDLGEYQNRPFLVMEYLEGHSLESLLRARRPMTVLEKINVIVEVCQGLGYAHQHGIIHRDIKPANIMVSNDGGVKIVDFGIARLGDNTLTRTGQIVGSLYYMPPEQLRDRPVDARADIYSTGVVLYHLLTYALPFEGETTASTLAKIVADEPPPFRQFALTYPPELEAITRRALSKERDQRFPTAEAFAAALTEVLEGFKQASIHEYLTKAELLQQSNQLQQAQDYLLKVLKLDRQHAAAARQLSALRARLQALRSAERAQYLTEQAEDAYARDEFDAALALLNQAIELCNTPELQTLRKNIEDAKGVAEVVSKAVARAEAAQRAGDLDSAKNAIDSAISRRPNDSKIRVLGRAIERDLEERERQRQVEGLLDEARRQMSGRKFTAALNLLREAQKLDPSTPQLRTLLEKLAAEHQQEKQRREIERLNREVQEAIDRDDYKAASARAAAGLAKFPNETGLARLKELADTQVEIAAQKEFARTQISAAQHLLDTGQTQRALDVIEKALQKIPQNARLESLRTLIQDRILKERAAADKATSLRQANEAISLGRYPNAIQILDAARLRFVDTADVDELLRFSRDQQAKARRREAIDSAMRETQRLLAEQDFEGAVGLLEKAAGQLRSEDIDLLLLQARDQRDAFRREVEAAIAKGNTLLEEGAIANAREFLNSRPYSYRQSTDFRDLLERAESTPIPSLHDGSSEDEAALVFASPAKPVLTETKLPPPWRRKPAVLAAAALAVALAGLMIWWLKPAEAYLTVRAMSEGHPLSGAQVSIDDKDSGKTGADGTVQVRATPGQHRVQVTADGYRAYSDNSTLKLSERKSVTARLEPNPLAPTPPPAPGVKVGTLVVQSNLAGADVFIDGQLKGVTGPDNKFRLELDPRTYKLQVKKSGYQDSPQQRIEIVVNQEKPVTLNLVTSSEGATPALPADAYLIIQSSPGAEVRVDGRTLGKVSRRGGLSVKVNPGTRHVQVNLDGYDSWSGSATLVAGDHKNIQAVLRPKVVAKLPEPPKPAATGTFSASAAEIDEGQSAQLVWNTRNASEVSIDPEASGLGPKGSIKVSPPKTTTYTLIAKGAGGEYRATAEIVVRPKRTADSNTVSLLSGGSADAAAIKELLYKFSQAYGDCKELMALWPSLTPGQCRAVEESTRKLKQTRLKDNCPGSPNIYGDAADWNCIETVTYLDGTERKATKPLKMAFRFKKKNGVWYVDSHSVK